MIKLAVLLLAAATAEQSADMCELQAISMWNKLATDSKAYTDKRFAGVIDVKLRAKLRTDFEAVMACPCF
jgi:hypothetical protein